MSNNKQNAILENLQGLDSEINLEEHDALTVDDFIQNSPDIECAVDDLHKNVKCLSSKIKSGGSSKKELKLLKSRISSAIWMLNELEWAN